MIISHEKNEKHTKKRRVKEEIKIRDVFSELKETTRMGNCRQYERGRPVKIAFTLECSSGAFVMQAKKAAHHEEFCRVLIR